MVERVTPNKSATRENPLNNEISSTIACDKSNKQYTPKKKNNTASIPLQREDLTIAVFSPPQQAVISLLISKRGTPSWHPSLIHWLHPSLQRCSRGSCHTMPPIIK